MPSTEEVPEAGRWARLSVLAAVMSLAAILAWRTESSRDFGYHLATGRWILEHRAWPTLDPFTFTLSDRPYVDMHGLFQIALALAYRGGMVGVGLLRVAFTLLTAGFLWLSCRQRGVRSPVLLGLGFALALLTLEPRLMTRPELASLLCLAAQLWLLRRHADSGDRRWLFATVPLQLIWVWSHALSTFGIAVLGLYAASSLVAGLRRRSVDPTPWLALAGASAVMFLNPYGAGGVSFLWGLHTRIQTGNAFADSISELLSPFSRDAVQFPALRFFRWMLVATGVVVLARAARLALFDLAVVVLFGALAATRVRVVGLFAVAALPVALEAAADLGRTAPAAVQARAVRWRPLGLALALLILGGLCHQTITGGLYGWNRYPIRVGYAESPGVFPVGTTATLERLGLRGRLFNAVEFGGYLAMHLAPGEKTFIDGRLEVMGEEFYELYMRAISGAGWDEVDARYHPTLALVPANRSTLIQRLRKTPGWSLVDVDAVALLFARDTPENRAAIAEAQEQLRRLDAPAQASEDALVPPPRPGRFAALVEPRAPPFEHWGRGSTFYQLGMFEAARRELGLALRADSRPEPVLVKTYLATLLQLGRTEEARAWCSRLLELSPGDRDAQALLQQLAGSSS